MIKGQLDDFKSRSWDIWESVIFQKTKEKWGGFSNMCADFPIEVNGIKWLTSEALYQALRFPGYPDIQEEIRSERSPMAAKMKSKPYRETKSRKDWEDVRIEAMRWCLGAKLIANTDRFGALLKESRSSDVVERSHRDRFWGAVQISDDYLQGQNVLGVLITQLRHSFQIEGLEVVNLTKPPGQSKLFGKSEFYITTISVNQEKLL